MDFVRIRILFYISKYIKNEKITLVRTGQNAHENYALPGSCRNVASLKSAKSEIANAVRR